MGGKSSGGGHVPIEAANTAKSAQRIRIVDAISEGVISGFANGDRHPFKSIFLNDTPVQDKSGSFNFKGIKAYFTKGTEDQTYVPSFDKTERSIGVQAKVVKATAITRTVVDKLVDAVRVTVGVERNVQVKDNGDQVAANTNLVIRIVKAGKVVQTEEVTFDEKGSDVFYQDVFFGNLPETPFDIKVTRLSPDAKSNRITNDTYFASYVEIISTKFSYPHTALAFYEIDSAQFGGQVPRRNILVKGMVVQVPKNYDPIRRAYSGIWDGGFKQAWTNNPAWVLYDLLTNPRYSSVARRFKPSEVDKWALYKISRYCDELVDDGFGKKEPRYVCNVAISDQRQAGEIFNDICSIFRGLAVWDGQQITVVMDDNPDPICEYNNTNVVDGIFTYSGVALKAIHTAVHVKYVDETDGYRVKTEYIADDKMIERYGLNLKSVTAFGVTKRSYAIRYGKGILETEKLQQNAVSFTVGREGLRHKPFDVIRVADNDYAGANIGGRVVAIEGNIVELDREVDIKQGIKFSYTGSSANIKDTTVVTQVAKNKVEVTDNQEMFVGSTWVLFGTVKPRLYRTISIKENSDAGTYTISAIKHDPRKYSKVDNSAVFDKDIVTLHRDSPLIIGLNTEASGDGLRFTWDGVSSVGSNLTYEVELLRDGKIYARYSDLKTPEIKFQNLPNGHYTLKIRARNLRGVLSDVITKYFTINYEITGVRTTPLMFAIQIDWVLPQTVISNISTELRYGRSDDIEKSKVLAVLPYPQSSFVLNNVEMADTYYFWARVVDAKGVTGEYTEVVSGECSTDPEPIVKQIQDSIGKDQLTKDLQKQFDSIEGLDEKLKGLNSVETKIKNFGDNISNVNKSLEAVKDTQNKFANEVKKVVDIEKKTDDLETAVQVNTLAITQKDEAQSMQLIALNAKAESNTANIDEVKQTVTNKEKALAQEIKKISTEFNSNKSTVATNIKSLTDKNNALAEAHKTIKSQIEDTSAYLDVLEKATTQKDTAQAVRMMSQQAELNKNKSSIDEVKTTITTKEKALAQEIKKVETKFNTDIKSNISQVNEVISTKEKALAQEIKKVESKFNADIKSNISQVNETITTKEKSLAQEIKRVESNASKDLNAKVVQTNSTVSKLDGTVKALTTLKTETLKNNKKVVAGLAIGSDGSQGSVLIYSDKFAIVNKQGGQEKYPFIIVTENGKTKLALDGSMYATGTISGDKLVANTTVTAPKIKGGEIDGGHIKGSKITGTNIEGNKITGGKIIGARIEGVDGHFSGTVSIENLVGGVVHEVTKIRLHKSKKVVTGKTARDYLWKLVERANAAIANQLDPNYRHLNELFETDFVVESSNAERTLDIIDVLGQKDFKPENFVVAAKDTKGSELTLEFGTKLKLPAHSSFVFHVVGATLRRKKSGYGTGLGSDAGKRPLAINLEIKTLAVKSLKHKTIKEV